MVHEYRPDMKLYVVVWELNGELMSKLATHAASAAEAISNAQSWFAEHPEHDFPGRDEMTVSVRDARDDERQNPD
jgi:hypothetical protein